MTHEQEREAFEAWVLKDLLDSPVHTSATDKQWRAWQARAASTLAQPASVPAVTDAMHRAAMVYLAEQRVAVASQHVNGALHAALAAAPAATQPEAQPASVPDLYERIAEAHDASLDDDHRACRVILTEVMSLLAAAPAATQPAQDAKQCLNGGDCKHGSWCSEVYCQERCEFVKECVALNALAELCDEATGGWDLPPSAVARIGLIARKAIARQDPQAYDRGVISGLRQAASICTDREDITADAIKAEIEACIAAALAAPQPEAQSQWHAPAKRLVQWLHCMSYNDSYFGEPAGYLKQCVNELKHLLPPLNVPAAPSAQAEPTDDWHQYAAENEGTAQHVIERHRAELGRAYRCIQGMHYALAAAPPMVNEAYHAVTIAAAKRFVFEGAMDGSDYFVGKPAGVLHAALALPAQAEQKGGE